VQITFFDILFLSGMLGGAALGFYRGIFRQAATTVTIYVSTVASTLMYRSLSRMLSGRTGQPTPATDVLAFILLMVVLQVLFTLMLKDLLGNIDVDRMGIWVNITGMVFGFINAAIWCAVILIVLRSATGGEKWMGYQGVQSFIRNQTRNSWMAYVFRPFMRLMLAIIEPWLFGHSLPPLLLNAL
jgi:uncharacterized membrane protein required for colicin V production